MGRELIWQRLEERGIHGKLLETIKAMYSKVTQKVRINGNLGEGFPTFYGVKQGDPLSTDLFGIMIEVQQCFILFSSFPMLFAFVVGGLGFEFCFFVAGWRHALPQPYSPLL